MEVLIAIFVLSIGLLGVAALIPLGQMALMETAKADRSGACGRAAMREIQVRRMLDFRYWYWLQNAWAWDVPDNFVDVSSSPSATPIVIDPLGYANYENYFPVNPLLARFGTNSFAGVNLLRRTLRPAPLSPAGAPDPITYALANQMFFWSDELPFDAPKNSIARPRLVTATDPHTGIVSVVSEGSYSWFFTVMPAATEMSLPVAQRRVFNVSVVVCYKRNLQPESVGTSDGEHTAYISASTGFPGMGIGGGTVILTSSELPNSPKINVKENQWVMLYHLHRDLFGNLKPQLNRCSWYRVVGVGMDVAPPNGPTLSLHGPDWNPNLDAVLVVVPGAIGVYTTTIELDWDPLWTK